MKKVFCKSSFLLPAFIFLLFNPGSSSAQLIDPGVNVFVNQQPEEEDLRVFRQWIKWNNPGSMLIHFITGETLKHYDVRSKEVAQLVTAEDWIGRQNSVRKKLEDIIGDFPAKTPLNAKVTGVIRRDGYRIEKIIFESFPGFYVPGCLYIPEKIKGRIPAVLHLMGHNQESFRNELYQVISYNLVKKGMVVFAIDPPGQGEHVQQYDPEIGFSSVGYSVEEHNYLGNWCFLSGYSSAKYFIWDALRAIDYLVSRREVDSERIGVTGFSGGGTITSYIGALDERVKVAVPCSWSNANRRLIETKGIQDAESHLYHGLMNGISNEDLIELRAPRPTLLTFVSRDEYLCLQGAREAYTEALGAFRAFGRPDNLVLVEDDSKHWLTPKIRHAIYSFFIKHFDLKVDPAEIEADILPREQLAVTPTGQIATFIEGKMIFDLNKEITADLLGRLENSRKNDPDHIIKAIAGARDLSGFRLEGPSPGRLFINGKYQREGYSVGKYAIEVGDDYAIPLLLFVPYGNNLKYPAVIYLHPEGKQADAGKGGRIEQLVRNGFVVAAVDLAGVGEVKNTAGREPIDSYTALQIGRSIPGIRAENIVIAASVLSRLDIVDPAAIVGLGIGEMCIPLVHAAAFSNVISSIVLDGPLVSYRTIAMNRNYRTGFTVRNGGDYWHPYEVDFSWGVGGALTSYDLPDLIAGLAPRKVALNGIRNEMLQPADEEVIRQDLSFPFSVYSARGVPRNIMAGPSGDTDYLSVLRWCLQKD
ncbi:MAG TPA: alpha/beta hydrolase family protein [Bacteroidales bacterium]|jgi:dienelactone hydrolase|nr:xylan esterase [Bacteroidales bacterium]HNR41636.1 alpha/beta hydrolase family protein [Bacteroidales bacterium]HPM18660.1 alpha/beta hydrolase family protein [Bacteroidales bacterium]HQG77694.1 alpha/beta hydrolase family protein [Bacteroidales bacterium]